MHQSWAEGQRSGSGASVLPKVMFAITPIALKVICGQTYVQGHFLPHASAAKAASHFTVGPVVVRRLWGAVAKSA